MSKLTIIRKALPTLLTIGSCVGTLAIAYLSAKAGCKSRDAMDEVLDEKEPENEEDIPKLTVKEKVTTTWKYWIAPGVAILVTCGMSIAANRLDARVIAGLAATATGGYQKLNGYRSAAKDVVGEEKVKEIDKRFYETTADPSIKPINEGSEVDTGKVELFYEPICDKYIWTTEERIKSAMYELNNYISDLKGLGKARVSWFYEFIGVPVDKIPDQAGELVWYVGALAEDYDTYGVSVSFIQKDGYKYISYWGDPENEFDVEARF